MPSMTAPAVGAVKPRTSLNKRVAFPMQSSAAAVSSNVKTTAEGLPLPFSTAKYKPPSVTPLIPEASSTPQPVLPPPPSAVLNPSIPHQSTSTKPVGEAFDSMTAKQFSNSVFGRLVDSMATTTDAGKMTEIRKRLDALDQMWQESKLDESAQKKLFQLAKGNSNENFFAILNMKSKKYTICFLNFSSCETALECNDIATAMEKHRLLVTQHINVSTQWATALRQIILSISSESESNAQNAPAVLPDTEVVHFVDVSSKPIVLDSNPFVAQESMINQGPATLPISNHPSDETNQNSSANVVQSNSENESKSRFGRFGRILHI